MKLPSLLVLLASALATTSNLYSATIVFGGATNIAADIDISTTGTLLNAFNFSSTSATTINGVTFAATASNPAVIKTFGTGEGSVTINGNSGGGFTSPTGLSTAYTALLNADFYSFSSITFNNLTIGNTYEIQLFANDSTNRGSGGERGTTFTAGNSVTLDVNTGVNNPAGGTGQYTIGIFTADATTQAITAVGVGNVSYIAAAQIRAVPEPDTVVILAGSAGLLALLRRRSVSHA